MKLGKKTANESKRTAQKFGIYTAVLHLHHKIEQVIEMRPKTPMKYVVIDRDRLYTILSEKPWFHIVDRIKFAILHDLIGEECTMNDVILIFEKYAIDYHVRQTIIEIKRSVNDKHEIPEEIAFVTCRNYENPREWDNYGRCD